ncbi:MAG: SDR family oxidoreductase [Rhodospirillaceae bacterium]|nr:MAG: SDR family oxidoreductase [Rhodospirillaceae bacterium]
MTVPSVLFAFAKASIPSRVPRELVVDFNHLVNGGVLSRLTKLFDLTGRTALITGAGKVPVAIANLFREAGATVTHATKLTLDEAGVAEVFAPLGDLDILVNGSARTGPWTLETLTLDEWDRVHITNVRGAFLLMREAVRMMRAHGRGGRLINLSTIGSVHPVLNGNFAYGSSRAGTNALTRQFAMDFARDGILSNCILVGAIPSDPFPEGVTSASGPGTNPERLPLGLGTPEDIAPTALLLASAAGRYINGQSIVVDGGYLIA